MIRWLHISDLHLGDDDFSSRRLRDKLTEFLKNEGRPIDYIFITGDIRTAGPGYNGYTPEMAAYILSLCEACGAGVDRLFIVPGNHDVNRDAPGRDEAVRRVMFHRKGCYDPASGTVEDELFRAIWQGQKEFRELLSQIYPAERLSLYNNPVAPHFNIETDDFNILHVDSTISYTAGQEACDLIVGMRPLYDAFESVNRSKPAILLTHYPFTALLQDERKMLTPLLHDYGVSLWLAGHEHDQNLQPIKYVQMLQAGELRREASVVPAIIIGEYDPDTFRSRAMVYTWYNEGWSRYPFVDLDAANTDVYEFMMTPADSNARSGLAGAALRANEASFSRLPAALNRSLFPKIESDGCSGDMDSLLRSAWSAGCCGITLLGDGGMGKSTMLLDFCRESSRAAIYVSAEQMASLGIGVDRYCIDALFDGDADRFRRVLMNRYAEPSLIVVVDGLNEVEAESEARIMREIRRLNLAKGIQTVIASRTDFTSRYNLHGYRMATLAKLEDDVLTRFFTAGEWETIRRSANLDRLLRNPMLVTIYKEICSVIDDYRDVEFLNWRLPVESATDLFCNYYCAQIALMMKRNDVNGAKIMLAKDCIDRILPAVAYTYESSFSISRRNADFRQILSRIVSVDAVPQSDALRAIGDCYRVRGVRAADEGAVTDLLLDELHLMHRDNLTTSFNHQMYRDYLSARYIIGMSTDSANIMNIWNERLFPSSVAVHIGQSCADSWHGIALRVKQAAEGRDDAEVLVRNLMECFPAADRSGVPDYSGLNLCGIRLPDLTVASGRVSLRGSRIDAGTLGLYDRPPKPCRVICFSPDGRTLAAASDRDLSLFDVCTYQELFRYHIGKRATKLVFYDKYLLVNAGSLVVFSADGGWRCTGEIKSEGGSLFGSTLHSITACGDRLCLCYKSRRLIYDLTDCSLTERSRGPYAEPDWESAANLMELRKSANLKSVADLADRVVASASVGELCAKSYADCRIEIFSGGELTGKLGEGVTVLQDSAISGDGSIAATLSSGLFDGRRRVQLWDMNRKVKTSELFCDGRIRTLHLSENGRWILGTAEKSTWIYDIGTHAESWSGESFVSNQHGKLITYGDHILCRTHGGDGRLFFLNLASGEKRPVDSPAHNPRIVTLLRNNTLAAVDGSGCKLSFRSERNGSFIEKYNPGETILAIQTFRSHPFIAAAASTGLISIYHTGTGQRTRKIENRMQIKMTAGHPEKTIMAHTDGRHHIVLEVYKEVDYGTKKHGWWRHYVYGSKADSDVLDMAFNVRDKSLTAIFANGTILSLSENDGTPGFSSRIITAFDTSVYDFSEVVSASDICDVLKLNGCISED